MRKKINIVQLLIFLTLSLFFACKSKQKTPTVENKPSPSWVKKTPSHQDYYIGIGIINKNESNYRESANKLALDAIAKEISVNISSESVLKTLENNTSFNQDYLSNIQVNSDKYLEGYEMVDSYESETHYYVYYRLSKQKYQEIKQQRYQDAVDLSLNFYHEAQNNIQNDNYRIAVINLSKAMDALSDYLDQSIKVVIQEEEYLLPLEIIRTLEELQLGIQIQTTFDEKTFTYGAQLPLNAIGVTLISQKGNAIGNFPLEFKYKAQFTQSQKKTTNSNGEAFFELKKIKSDVRQQFVKVILATEDIIKATTSNRIVRNLLMQSAGQEKNMQINVELPKVYIDTLAEMDNRLLNQIQNSLISNQFETTKNKEEAALFLSLDGFRTKSQQNNRNLGITYYCSATLVIKQKNGQSLFAENIPEQRGTQSTETAAKNIALEELGKIISSRYIPLFANRYFN